MRILSRIHKFLFGTTCHFYQDLSQSKKHTVVTGVRSIRIGTPKGTETLIMFRRWPRLKRQFPWCRHSAVRTP